MERHVLDDSVALVEDAEHGDALRHRSHSALPRRGRLHLGHSRRGAVLLRRIPPARGERDRDQQRSEKRPHAYSGIHGS
jgi:hypothetical protein